MKWFIYKITLDSGISFDFVCGEWLKEEKYKFFEVEKIKKITDKQVKEYHAMEDELYRMWDEQLPPGYFEE